MIVCNLAVLLAERGLKITKVSKDTGLSRTTLTALYYNRGQGIQLDTMDTLCNYLKITPNELFKKKEPEEGILKQIKDLSIEAEKEWEDLNADTNIGEMSAYRKVLDLFKGAKEFNCGLYARYEAVIKGKCDKRDEVVELPSNYKLIIVEVEN